MPRLAKAGYSVASRPTSLVWVARSRIVARIGPVVAEQRVAQRGVRPGAGTPCHRAAAKTRLAWRLRSGSVCSQASTSGSSATPSAHSRKQAEP